MDQVQVCWTIQGDPVPVLKNEENVISFVPSDTWRISKLDRYQACNCSFFVTRGSGSAVSRILEEHVVCDMFQDGGESGRRTGSWRACVKG